MHFQIVECHLVCFLIHNYIRFIGRRSKPKRQFIQPALRQAVPVNSVFVEALGDCHWRCKLCKRDIFAAVISAGAIRHFRVNHPLQLQNMQYELCKVIYFINIRIITENYIDFFKYL